MDRATSRRVFNEFSSEIDLNSPDGIIRSSDVDRYIESALKPLFEEGKAFKRVNINRRTGIRDTRYSYRGGKNIQDSINAVLGNMHAALGYDVDPATGNVRGTAAPPPVSITSQGRHYYNETRERILDPRTAASIKAQALRAGGSSVTDKATGITTTLVRSGLSGETRAMRKLVDDTDRRYLAGQLPSSALADGASPASIEERAMAQVARQANVQDARQRAKEDYIRRHPGSQLAIDEAIKMRNVTDRETKARVLAAESTPGTAAFRRKVFRGIRAGIARRRAVQRYIKAYPDSPLAANARREKREARWQKTKSLAGGAARIARNVLALTVSAILTAVTLGVALLAKSFQVIAQIGTDIRKRAIGEAKYNFAPDTIRQFEIFAAQHPGLKGQKDLLARAAGGIHAAWSTPLNYTESGFNQLAPYLREGTVKLVSMATADGDANVLNIMGSVIDDLVGKSLSGISGAKTFDPDEGRHRAFSGNLTALSAHNEAWGELMNQYWHDFMESKAASIGAWQEPDKDGAMRTMTFENWVTQGGWGKKFIADTGISSPAFRTAAEEARAALSSFTGTFGNLGRDVATALAGNFNQIVEEIRNIANSFLAPYFPVFAMRENQRAVYLNMQAKLLAESLLPGYESEADRALRDIGYDRDLTQFKGVLDALWRGDTSQIPYHIDLEQFRSKMGVFARYYHTKKIVADVEEEERKAAEAERANREHVSKVVVGTPASIASTSGQEALVLQHRLDMGARNVVPQAAKEDARYTARDFLTQMTEMPGRLFQGAKAGVTAVVNYWIPPRVQAAHDEIERQAVLLEREYHKGATPISAEPYYRSYAAAYEKLISAYNEEGDSRGAYEALKAQHQFYLEWAGKLATVETAEDMERRISRNEEIRRSGDRLATAAMIPHPAELVAFTYAQIRQYEAQSEYAAGHTSQAERAAVQSRANSEITSTEWYNDLHQLIIKEKPSIQGVYAWIRANRGNSVYVDAFDEASSRAMSDIVINFNTNGRTVHTLRMPNTYNLARDVNLDSVHAAGMENIAHALEAWSPARK